MARMREQRAVVPQVLEQEVRLGPLERKILEAVLQGKTPMEISLLVNKALGIVQYRIRKICAAARLIGGITAIRRSKWRLTPKQIFRIREV